MATKSTPVKKSNPLPIVFILVTLAILVGGGYFVYNTVAQNKTSPFSAVTSLTQLATGNSMPQVTEADFLFVEDPLIRKHFAAQANTRIYKTISVSDGRGKGEESIVEIDAQNINTIRMRMMNTSLGKTTSDLITIGDTTYVKDLSDNTWWMQKAKPTDMTNDEELNQYTVPEDFKDMYMEKTDLKYKALGEEACGSLTCYKYEEVSNSEGKRTFWFDTKSLLLRKETHSYGEFTSTTTYNYEGISINNPSPTKPVPEGKTVYDMMITSMMPEEFQGEFEAASKMMPSQDDINTMMKEYESMQDDGQPSDYSEDSY